MVKTVAIRVTVTQSQAFLRSCRHEVGLHSKVSWTSSGGTMGRYALRCPACPPRFFPLRGIGGLRFKPIGSDEGGFDELVELSLSRASRSLTRASNVASCCRWIW